MITWFVISVTVFVEALPNCRLESTETVLCEVTYSYRAKC